MSRKFSRPGGALEPSALLVTLLLVASPGCSRENTQAAVPAPRYQSDGSVHLSSKEREALGLAVAPATKGHLPYVALRYGRVQARPGGDAVVVAPVTARVAEPARVQPGATVAAGAVLLEVEPQLAASERISLGVQGEELAGQIESTRRELETLKAEAARAKELAQASFLSTEKLQQAETSVTTTQARLSALLRAQEVQVQGRTHRMAVRAPVAGTVVSLTVPPLGAVVQPGDELARLVTPGPHWVEVLMPPEEPVADSYEVAAGRDWVPARLVSRGGVVAAEDGARHDRLEVGAAKTVALLPGAVVAVRLARDDREGILLPESALVPGIGGEVVYVEVSPGVFVPRPVQVAARFGGRVRLASGLSGSEQVVVRGAMALRGEAFRVESPEED